MNIKKFTTLVVAILLTTAAVVAQKTALEPDAARLEQHVSHLASDALDGRRTGTAGANEAARYIAGEFERIGLRPGVAKYLQTFPYVAGLQLGNGNELQFSRESGFEGLPTLRVGEDWMPLGFSSNAKVAGGLVFAGFGITAAELNYDDYAGLNIKDSIAVVLQGTPDGDNPHGQFGRYEEIRWKAIAARNAGARALVVVAREQNFKDEKLAKLSFNNNGGEAGLPVLVISRSSVDSLIGTPTLNTWEEIAKQKSQATRRLISGHFNINTNVIRNEVPAYNVVGVLEGSDPVLKKENIVIGAHYDHLGRGGEGIGSLAPRSGEIHHGADDNASGTAGLIELARVFSAQRPKLKRTVIFIAFGGEEEGLLGSNYYVNHPLTPLTNTVAMINMDMIGRMQNRKLVIGGVGTAKEWRQIISQANASTKVSANSGSSAGTGIPIVVSANGRPIMTVDPRGVFELTLTEDGFGPSDHSSFYGKQIPVLFFWTGTHNDYHKPSDTADKINYFDEARILSLVARIVRDVDSADQRLTYTSAKTTAPRTGGFRVYLGTIPNYADSSDGLLLDGVRDDSPASKAGLKAGDRIIKIGNRDVKNVYDYTFALGELKAGQEYVIEVVRAGQKLSLKITPEARK